VVKISDAYEFPVKPGTPEWAALESHDQMLQACQVPENLLRRMSTKGLVETVLNYPLYGDMLAYLDLQEGFDNVAANFNGLSELLKRSDAGTALLERYRSMNPLAIDKGWTSEERGQYDARFTYIEILLAQEAILNKLTETERRDLLVEAIKKMDEKQQLADVYGHFGQERTAWVMARILQCENYTPFTKQANEDPLLQDFIKTGTIATDAVLGSILVHARQFLVMGAEP